MRIRFSSTFITSVIILAFGASFPAYSAEIFVDNFENSNVDVGEDGSPWRYSGNKIATITQSPTDSNGKAVHFTLNQSDPVSDRTELVLREVRNFSIGSEYWYGFSIYLPSEGYVYDDDSEILFQFHGAPDLDAGEPYRNPMLALFVDRGRWAAVNRWDSKALTPDRSSYEGSKVWTMGSYETDSWTDWVMRIKWSYQSDGIIQIWKDGELVVERNGPNTYNDEKGPYLKVGIYKYFWDGRTTLTTHRDLYYDEVRIADENARYDDVVPWQNTSSPTPLQSPPSDTTPMTSPSSDTKPMTPATPFITIQ